MGFWKKLVEKSRKSLKYSVSDPASFEEVWSFTSTRIRVISLFVVLVLATGFGMSYIISWMGGPGSGKNDATIERKQLEEQFEKIAALEKEAALRSQYNGALLKILRGEVPINSNIDSLAEVTDPDYGSIQTKPSKSEIEVSKKVKDDMRTGNRTEAAIPYFKSPVKGVVSDAFTPGSHPGIDVVTEKNESIKACLSGTVLYAGFTRQDGYIVILDHGNGYSSVYKHARKALKKIGDRVQLGDPIAIVGSTGSNSTGPHLHFELWYNQSPVNPEDYIKFTR
ncbi:MAG: M23 family metallopeptidase [bacterium]|nr:M23 family metallopeptidase [bacterium]